MLGLLSERKLIEKIHAEVDNAANNALKTARFIIDTNNVSKKQTEMSVKLKKLGFINNPIILDTEIKLKEKNKALEEAELIDMYKQQYPTLKFIKVEQLEYICNKYGLIYAPIRNFIGMVPEKNLLEMENCPILNPIHVQEDKNVIKVTEFTNAATKEIINFLKNWVEIGRNYSGIEILKGYNSDIMAAFLHSKGIQASGSTSYVRNGEYKVISQSGLFIAAPKGQFNIKKKRSFNFITIGHIDNDPIVFRYCKGGIQVITKWGLEGKDPILFNEIEN